VSLTSAPSAPIELTLNNARAPLGLTPTRLMFGPADWATPQRVTLTSAPDCDAIDQLAVIFVSSPGAAPRDVPVTIAEPGTDRMLVQPSLLTIPETGSATITASLACSARITVWLVSSDPAVATVSPQEMTITNVPQAIIVTGVEDIDRISESVRIRVRGGRWGEAEVRVDVRE